MCLIGEGISKSHNNKSGILKQLLNLVFIGNKSVKGKPRVTHEPMANALAHSRVLGFSSSHARDTTKIHLP